jgi:hypothetical protein
MATGNGGSSDRAISIIGEAPWVARNQRVTAVWLTKPLRSDQHEHAKD